MASLPTLVRPAELARRLGDPLLLRGGRPALLAVDYGTTKIGLAHAPSLGGPPAPLCTVRVASTSPSGAVDAGALERVVAAVRGGAVGGLVVGWPVDPSGRDDTPECRRTLGFLAQLLAAGVYTPAALWDERGTTAAARAGLRAAAPLTRRGTAARRHVVPHELRGRVDELAAVEMLRGFLQFAAVAGRRGGGAPLVPPPAPAVPPVRGR